MHKLMFVITALTVTACHQSQIQGDYHVIRGECRSMAETKVAAASTSTSRTGRNAELVTAFSDCMAKRGWAVAAPKRAKSDNAQAQEQAAQPNAPAPQPQPAPPAPARAAQASATSDARYQSTQPVETPAGTPDYSIYQPEYPAPAADVRPPAIGKTPRTPARY